MAQSSGGVSNFGPLAVVVTLLVAMGISLLLVAFLLCQFNALRRRSQPQQQRGRRQKQRRPQKQRSGDGGTTVAKGAAADLENEYQYASPQRPQAAGSSSAPTSTETVSPPMRDTATEFLEFLSKKWEMQERPRARSGASTYENNAYSAYAYASEVKVSEPRVQMESPAEWTEPQVQQQQPQMSTFRAVDNIQPQFAFSEFFDICEEVEEEEKEEEVGTQDVRLTMQSDDSYEEVSAAL